MDSSSPLNLMRDLDENAEVQALQVLGSVTGDVQWIKDSLLKDRNLFSRVTSLTLSCVQRAKGLELTCRLPASGRLQI